MAVIGPANTGVGRRLCIGPSFTPQSPPVCGPDSSGWNFAGTIGVNMIGIALASVGLLNPPLAAFVHVTSELVFILNSARPPPRTQQERSRRLLILIRITARAPGGAQQLANFRAG